MSNPSPARLADAGRELDALIAERVMGWRWLPTGLSARISLLPPVRVAQMLDTYVEKNTRRGYKGDVPDTVPHYSTDIAAAWSVVEKIRELGWPYCTVQAFSETGDTDVSTSVGYRCVFERYRSPVEVKSPHTATAPHAICLAALAALSEPAHA